MKQVENLSHYVVVQIGVEPDCDPLEGEYGLQLMSTTSPIVLFRGGGSEDMELIEESIRENIEELTSGMTNGWVDVLLLRHVERQDVFFVVTWQIVEYTQVELS